MKVPSISVEDYLEKIYELESAYGLARIQEIAELLGVTASSVTKMVQRLDRDGLVRYERYRGVHMTERGRQLGRAYEERHQQLAAFLRLLGVDDEQVIYGDVEGIEHHVSPQTMRAIARLAAFLQASPHCLQALRAFPYPKQDGLSTGQTP